MVRATLAALALICFAACAQAQNSSAAEPNERIIESRAVEAVIWGMPAVNYDLMLQEMLTKTPGKVGEVIYWGRPLDWHNQTLTPNPDALYFMTFFDTKDGPIVLDLPPGDANGSFNGNIVNVWQMPLEDAGLLGVDKGKGGKFADPAAGLQRQSAGRLRPTAIRYLRRLYAVARQSQESRRRRCREVHCLWQADESLFASAGRQSAGRPSSPT